MVRASLFVFLIAVAATVSGCSTTKEAAVRVDTWEEAEDIDSSRGQAITGYVLLSGIYHAYDGRVRLATPDTLDFTPKQKRDWAWGGNARAVSTARSFRIPRDSVTTLYVVKTKTSTGRTVLTVIGVLVLTAAVVLAVAIATKESCPFLYSYDGERFVFDGEPYGGATMQALERTDWSELEHLRPSRGTYRLLVANEVDETQHTNSLLLSVVDHAPGTKVFVDKEGAPHAFRRLIPLTKAVDDAGRDLLRWLRDDDLVAWQPNLKDYIGLDSLRDTRNHITLEFARPRAVDRGYLISKAATHSWGSHMIRTMLAMRGNRIQEFYDAINASETYRSQLLSWNEREELFQLFPEMETTAGWVRLDYLPAGGPFIAEARAVPIDWSRVGGDTLRLRIHPPIGFWSLHSFHLAWEEESAMQTVLAPERASGDAGEEVVAALREDDTRYVDLAQPGEKVEVVFRAPPERRGWVRTVFARTRGWYEVHLHGLGDPDAPGIARLTAEPGYAVRRALDEFEEYQRTGVLLGTRQASDVVPR